MENKEQQILSEIKEMMASIRSQLELLDAKMAELQQTVGSTEEDTAPIDLDIEDFAIEDVDDVVDVDDLPFYDVPADLPEPESVIEELPAVEQEPVVEEEPVAEEETMAEAEPMVEDIPAVEDKVVTEEDPAAEDDDLPIFAEPEPVTKPVHAAVKPKTAVIDAMVSKQAWRTDMPGTAVKDIRSAISLNDRILFINMLFNQDPIQFQDALTRINQMASLDEVVDFVAAEYPEWNLESEYVYRFMMAVRRKVR